MIAFPLCVSVGGGGEMGVKGGRDKRDRSRPLLSSILLSFEQEKVYFPRTCKTRYAEERKEVLASGKLGQTDTIRSALPFLSSSPLSSFAGKEK